MDFVSYLIIGVIIYGVIFGVSDKGIFYNNTEDLYISFVPLLIIIITFLISALLGDWFNYIGSIVFIASVIYIIYNSFLYNKTFIISFPIGIAKIILSIIVTAAGIMTFLDKDSDARYSSGSRDTSTTWIFALLAAAGAALMFKLINGDRIRQTL